MNAGCMTQVRMVNSAIVTPREVLTKDRRLRTWPRNATNTDTKDNSIVLAKKGEED
jgi:hypothetical protein